MKTAIITFQDGENYGAQLQAYALKHVLSQDSDCDVLNFYNPHFHRKKIQPGLKGAVVSLLFGRAYQRKHERFQQFQKDCLLGDAPYLQKEDLPGVNGSYDLFVTGSDQVWNLRCSGGQTAYFLDFVEDPNKKFSYAASFGGVEFPEPQRVKELLSSFRGISIREESGQKTIAELLGRQVPVVLDPTLLMTGDQWKESFGLEFGEEYVLAYEVICGDHLIDIAQRYAEEKGMKLICITNSNQFRPGVKCVRDAGPREWLQLFAGSACVFTNSFHGLAFSLNFRKQFYLELLPPPASTNARMEELLNKLELSDRILKNGQWSRKIIDYSFAAEKIAAMREDSLSYVSEMLSQAEPSESAKI